MKTVLISGGAGFIGRKLAIHLANRGDAIRIMDNLSPQIHGEVPDDLDWLKVSNIELHRGSVTSRADWRRSLTGVDCVVHLAAETGTGQSMYEVARYDEVNSYGTALLLDSLAEQGSHSVERILLASSRSVYGEGRYHCDSCGLSPVYPSSRSASQLKSHLWEHACPQCSAPLSAQATKETDKERPGSIYAATKLAQEHLVRISAESFGLGYATFRFQNVYGEGQSLKNPYTGILSIFSTRIRRQLELPLFEDGLESRDFVHVDDVVRALVKGIDAGRHPNTVFNVGSGIPTSVSEVASELSLALNQSPKLTVTSQYRHGDIRHNFADISKIEKILGVTPQVDLKTGLKRFAEWVLTQPLPEDLLEKANKELSDRALMGN